MQNYLQTAVMQLNQQLATLTEQYPSTHPGATVLTYSIAELFSNVTTNPSIYGFMDITSPSYQVSRPDPPGMPRAIPASMDTACWRAWHAGCMRRLICSAKQHRGSPVAGSILMSIRNWQGPSFFADITGEYNYTVTNPDTHLFWDVVRLYLVSEGGL